LVEAHRPVPHGLSTGTQELSEQQPLQLLAEQDGGALHWPEL
jgi:hypothetical protein